MNCSILRVLLVLAPLAGVTPTLAAPSPPLAAPHAPSSPAVSTQPLSNTRGATRTLHIDAAHRGVDVIEMFAAMRPFAAKLAAQRPDLDADAGEWLQVENVPNGVAIRIQLPDTAAPAAKELADALVEWSEQYVKDTSNKMNQSSLEQAQKAVAETNQRMQAADLTYEKARDKLRDVTGLTDVSKGAVRGAVTRLEAERQKLELDALAKSARRDALEQTVAEAGKRVEQRVAEDPIAAELQKVVDAREQRVRLMKQQAAAALISPPEISEAVAAAAEARAKLLQRRHDAAAEAGGSTLDAFNRELMTLSIDSKELSAKLEYIKKQLDGLRQASDQEDSLTQSESDMLQLRRDLDKASNRLRELQQNIAGEGPPHIVIKESNSSANP